jgi:poly(hydroxyalkanoate) depolymerase family esterase
VRVFSAVAAAIALLLGVALAAGSAGAATTTAGGGPGTPAPLPPPAGQLQEVVDFGPNPTGVGMHLYVPPRLRHRPATVVAMHYCGGTGPLFFAQTDYASLADRYGFLVIYPTAGRADACFDVTSPQALVRDGGSDPVGIVSMVRHVRDRFHADRHRGFAVGFSSGAELVNVLLAAYPDVFAAGSVMAGSPVGCYTADGGGFNPNCENGGTIRTPRQWGDYVRAALPGYHGPRPRVQLWHGTADTIISYVNFGEEVKQWTDVLRARPAGTDQPGPMWTRTRYADRSGRTVIEAVSIEGAPHGIAFSEPDIEWHAIGFFGLTGRHR